ncbi:MAG: RimK/LysX family protein [Bacteroidota bacterium]
MANKQKVTIGRLDILDLPDLGVSNIRAKIDTGAYRCSIHCKKVHLEGAILKFTLCTNEGYKEYETKEWDKKPIKSSNGKVQQRYIIKTHIKIFGKSFKISISLADRSKMKNPLLIGRKILKGRFIVDVSKRNLSYEQKSQDK